MADEPQPFPYNVLERMIKELEARQADLHRLTEYHAGKHRLAFSSDKFRAAFGGLFSAFADNFIPLVVNAVEERLNIQGFRMGTDPTADKDAWAIWQANDLDAASQLAHKQALIKGDGYVIVWADGDGKPKVSVETPNQCIIAYDPGDRTVRLAGLKAWLDSEGKHATLMFADAVYRFKASPANEETWVPDQKNDATWPMPNPLGEVSMVQLVNDPSLDSNFGVSEFINVIPLQDAINKTVADMIVASEYIAFPQRYVTGLELEEDDQGNTKAPFQIAVDKLLVAEDAQANFGTLPAGDTMNHIKQIEMLVQHVSTQTRTPPHYFNVGGNLPSGDAIKAAETGLVAKARRKMRYFGEAWEEVIRLCFKVVGDPRADVTDGETIWGNPEYRSESELADALVKRAAIGVPRQQLWEDAGYTQTQISRFHAMEVADSLDTLLAPPAIPKLGSAPVVAEA
ncbi:phage portal protein [Leifsonia sp. NPDC058248]|uniref:phage portal protein n=1 Tax=Leifsonia sp. NPDC058248 TaxID=3346402 RepID=UPI0036DF1E60